MRISLQRRDESDWEIPVWIPYLYEDEIDVRSIQEVLFRMLSEKNPDSASTIPFLLEFCLELARELNQQFGYGVSDPSHHKEDLQAKGAALIHKALIKHAVQEME